MTPELPTPTGRERDVRAPSPEGGGLGRGMATQQARRSTIHIAPHSAAAYIGP